MVHKEFGNEQEIAEVTDIPVKTLRNLRYKKKLFNFYKVGKSVKYKFSEVFEAIEKNKIITKE